MRRRSLHGAVFAAVLALVTFTALAALGGCRRDDTPEPTAATEPRRDAFRRVVSLHPAVTETILALGADDVLVGLGTWDPAVPGRPGVPRLGDSFQVNLEALLRLEPDLVFCGSTALVERLEPHAGRFVVRAPKVDTLAEARRMIEDVADLLGRRDRGAALGRVLDDDMARAKAAAAARGGPAPRVLVVVERRPLTVAGGSSYLDELLRSVGAVNVARAMPDAWPAVSAEVVPSLAPDVILDAATGGGEPFPALGSARVVPAREDCLFRPGPRVGEALRTLERLLFPEAPK